MVGLLRWYTSGALWVCLFFGVAQAADPVPPENSDAMQLYLAQEFGPAIAQCERVEIEAVDPQSAFSLRDLEVNELTEAERGLLAEYLVPGLGPIGISKAISSTFRQLVDSGGIVPVNGVEVMLVQNEQTATLAGAQRFAELEPMEQLKAAWRGINPATGRFLEDFSDPAWRQFGVYIGKVEGEDAIMYLPMLDFESGKPGLQYHPDMLPHQVWNVIVFGETPGRILVHQTRLQQLTPTEEYPAKELEFMYPERAAEPAPLPETPQTLLDCDFSDVIHEFKVYPYGGAEVPEQPHRGTYYGAQEYYAQSLAEGYKPTPKECELLGQRVIRTKLCYSLSDLFISLGMLDRKYGRPPAGVIELHEELATPEGLAAFNALTAAEQYAKYGDAVNPITGKFYTTFSNPQWSPGGIYFEVIEQPEEVIAKYHELDKTGELPGRNPPWDDNELAGMRINIFTVFGEEPGTVLFRKASWAH
jgi:hypothetical protein